MGRDRNAPDDDKSQPPKKNKKKPKEKKASSRVPFIALGIGGAALVAVAIAAAIGVFVLRNGTGSRPEGTPGAPKLSPAELQTKIVGKWVLPGKEKESFWRFGADGQASTGMVPLYRYSLSYRVVDGETIEITYHEKNPSAGFPITAKTKFVPPTKEQPGYTIVQENWAIVLIGDDQIQVDRPGPKMGRIYQKEGTK